MAALDAELRLQNSTLDTTLRDRLSGNLDRAVETLYPEVTPDWWTIHR